MEFMMNETNFEHAIYGVLLQITVGLLTGNWWIGAAAGAFFFLGRAHATTALCWLYSLIVYNNWRQLAWKA